MPEIVQLVSFTENERAVFERVASPSIVGLGEAANNAYPRISAVRRAARAGEVWNAEQLSRLSDHLARSMRDREENVETLKTSHVPGAEGAAASAAGWLAPLHEAYELVQAALELEVLA
jgi:L-alanine-DL-glutamate epimerase-like enolase superfamily enzyme